MTRVLRRTENVATALAAVATLGFTAATLMNREADQSQVAQRTETKTITVVVPAERKTIESASVETQKEKPVDVRYLVKHGDTLWEIAARHYEDPVSGMRRIKKRNGFTRNKVLAGEVLVLPATERASSSSR